MKVEIEISETMVERALEKAISQKLNRRNAYMSSIDRQVRSIVSKIIKDTDVSDKIALMVSARVQLITNQELEKNVDQKVTGWIKHHVKECLKYARMQVFGKPTSGGIE